MFFFLIILHIATGTASKIYETFFWLFRERIYGNKKIFFIVLFFVLFCILMMGDGFSINLYKKNNRMFIRMYFAELKLLKKLNLNVFLFSKNFR